MNWIREKTSWRELITSEMDHWKEDWSMVESCTLDEAGLDEQFDSSWGCPCGTPFTLWTSRRVYFPVTYDGSEWVGSAARNPDGDPTHHMGG